MGPIWLGSEIYSGEKENMTLSRKHTAVSALALLAAVSLGGQSALAEETTQTRDLDTFTRILIKGAVDISVVAGEKEQAVEITAESRYQDRVETEVHGDTLVISQKGRRWRDVDLEVEISVVTLNGFVIDGAADAEVSGINSEEFELIVNGAGDIDLEGTCGSAHFEINGAGDLDASELKCKAVKIEINGAGDADVYASESIVAFINGVGDVEVYGNPSSVRPRIRGFGSFEIK
jgi:hypothetical protein